MFVGVSCVVVGDVPVPTTERTHTHTYIYRQRQQQARVLQKKEEVCMCLFVCGQVSKYTHTHKEGGGKQKARGMDKK